MALTCNLLVLFFRVRAPWGSYANPAKLMNIGIPRFVSGFLRQTEHVPGFLRFSLEN